MPIQTAALHGLEWGLKMVNFLRARAEALRTLANGSISASYAAVGTATTAPARIVCFTNNTAGDMIFSLDGVTDHFFVKAGSFKLFDVATNRRQNDPIFAIAQGTIFYVKQSTAPSSGDVYVEVIYGE